eukprot:TRINITY_DN10328_c0_g1_i2.p1 TRINITY_DN10328_c0_g1~~TRINITY_DN10328_c0_g1_i2.p1  ORF type:complete len:492 (+),score=45.62 TRINITY_DN10328_c0_g1_i2:97-1572(+)
MESSKTNTQFSCTVCGESFAQKFRLNHHKLLHTVKKSCEECEESFITIASLNMHRTTKHPKKKKLPPKIQFFPQGDTFYSFHQSTEIAKKIHPEKCTHCNQIFPCVTDLWSHLNIHTECLSKASKSKGLKYSCSSCEFCTNCQAYYDNHKKMHPVIKCKICGKDFSSEAFLELHEKHMHCEKCPCCEKTFASETDLMSHLNIHSEYPPKASRLKNVKYSCHHCDFFTYSFPHFESHVKVHSNSKVIKDLKLLKDQKKTKKLVKCDFCEDTFTTKKQLKSHMTKHGKKQSAKSKKMRPKYYCSYCDVYSYWQKNLTDHEKVHFSGSAPFKCDLCNIGFVSDDSLKCHKTKHHNEKVDLENSVKEQSQMLDDKNDAIESAPFKCDICDKGFLSKYALKCHQTYHNDETQKLEIGETSDIQNEESFFNENGEVLNNADEIDIVKHEIEDITDNLKELEDIQTEILDENDIVMKDEEIKEEVVDSVCVDPLYVTY